MGKDESEKLGSSQPLNMNAQLELNNTLKSMNKRLGKIELYIDRLDQTAKTAQRERLNSLDLRDMAETLGL